MNLSEVPNYGTPGMGGMTWHYKTFLPLDLT